MYNFFEFRVALRIIQRECNGHLGTPRSIAKLILVTEKYFQVFKSFVPLIFFLRESNFTRNKIDNLERHGRYLHMRLVALHIENLAGLREISRTNLKIPALRQYVQG